MNFLRRAGVDCFNLLQRICLAVATRGMNEKLARRDAERGGNHFRWFTPEEAVVAQALASVIVPSDEETPGIDEVAVLGPPAIVALDNLIMTSSDRQQLYSRGLLSFDVWALKERGCKFAEMPKEDQTLLFTAAQHIYEGWTASGSGMMKAWRRLRAVTKARNGSLFAAQLYQQIRDDCFQVFYTSRASWIWLNYDGPPMDEGYSSLVERR
jgi:Gluconate 2-dehydrogenase subunit 3